MMREISRNSFSRKAVQDEVKWQVTQARLLRPTRGQSSPINPPSLLILNRPRSTRIVSAIELRRTRRRKVSGDARKFEALMDLPEIASMDPSSTHQRPSTYCPLPFHSSNSWTSTTILTYTLYIQQDCSGPGRIRRFDHDSYLIVESDLQLSRMMAL